MQKLKSKTMAIMIAVLLTVSMTASMMLVPNAGAHTPAVTYPTYSFMSVSPNPVGVGQTVRVNFWVNLPPPTASAQYGDRWTNMSVYVTAPDGTTTKIGTYTSDDTGGTSTTYTPTVVGNYTFQMKFGGETLAGNNLPPGYTSASYPEIGDYYGPSVSNVFSVTVQQEQISYPPVVPLPTNYWTRPIYGENNGWYSIAGNWLGLAASTFAATGMYNATGNYNPYTTAPNSAHILWTKPEAFGGIIGGEFGSSETANYYSTSQYEPKFAPIIMQGILYYTFYPGASTYPEGWVAVDLHTGQTIWTKTEAQVNGEVLKCGQILNMITPNQYGAEAFLWSIPASGAGFGGSPSYMSMYDALTGEWILNVTGTTGMTLTEDDHGNLIGYYINSGSIFAPPDYTLCMWNSTADINLNVGNYAGGPSVTDQWMWRPPQGAQLAFNTTVAANGESSITTLCHLPLTDTSGKSLVTMMSYFGFTFASYLLGISAVQSGVVYMTGSTAGSSYLYQSGWMEEAAFSATDGSKLWGVTNRTEVPYSIVYSGGVWSGSNAYVELTESTLSVSGYSLTTGAQLWGPTALPNASPFSSLGANSVVANGSIYIWLYGGDVYSFNIVTGHLNWQYHTPPGGYESPYGVEPLWTFSVGTVADGKLFVPEGHMYSPPLFHKAQQLALNTTNGNVVWSIDAFDVTSAPAISDGVMTTLNAYDNQIYAWGLGPTAMTVTAPDVGVTTATPITIRGTVTDISAGTKQEAQAANFPNGVPAVSDASQTAWMEYVYMQQPCPTNVTGVPVTLSVLDSNHNYRQIGSTTSDGTGMFTFTWTPDIPGDYTVVANFAGSNSYYPSSAETSFSASSPAPTAAPTATPISNIATTSDLMMYMAVGVIAIIIAIAIVGLLLLRKRP
ncbi:MAG: PQQ-binding-like beta-propeller repeat protein [Candidatus Bathyarchaeia archaeon]